MGQMLALINIRWIEKLVLNENREIKICTFDQHSRKKNIDNV